MKSFHVCYYNNEQTHDQNVLTYVNITKMIFKGMKFDLLNNKNTSFLVFCKRFGQPMTSLFLAPETYMHCYYQLRKKYQTFLSILWFSHSNNFPNTRIRGVLHTPYPIPYLPSLIHAYMHSCVHAYMHTCVYAYMQKYIHAFMHTCLLFSLPATREEIRKKVTNPGTHGLMKKNLYQDI